MAKVIRKQARNRGIRLSQMKNGKRKYKTDDELLKAIIKHDSDIILKRANQTKNMLLTCKSIMAVINKNNKPKVATRAPPPPPPPPPLRGKVATGAPPPPPPPPILRGNKPKLVIKRLPPPPPQSIKKNKLSLVNELKAFQVKKGLKNISNKNAKESTA